MILLVIMSLSISGCANQLTGEPRNNPAPITPVKSVVPAPALSNPVSTSSIEADNHRPNIPTSSPEWTKYGRPSIAIFKNMQIGRKIFGLTVTDYLLKDFKREIKFSGKIRITGDYDYMDQGEFAGGWACFDKLDLASEAKMPKFSSGNKSNFCIANSDKLQKELVATATSGRATIDIDNFSLMYCECGAWSTADLVDVVSVKK